MEIEVHKKGGIVAMESAGCCCFLYFSCTAFVPGQPECLLEHTQQNVLSWLP